LLLVFGGFPINKVERLAMHNELKHYYLLTSDEAEMLACYRMMDPQAQAAASYLMAAQSAGCQNIAEPVRLSLVGKD
jgi:hypothetical protein